MPKILIFEDDKMLLDMYVTKFRTLGFGVAAYETPGNDPVAIVQHEQPDIISMDVVMPVTDGFKATSLIKADERTKDIPLFFLTTLGQPLDVQRGKQLGAIEYFVKADHTPSEIVSFVQEFLGLPYKIVETIPERVKRGRRFLDRLLGKK